MDESGSACNADPCTTASRQVRHRIEEGAHPGTNNFFKLHMFTRVCVCELFEIVGYSVVSAAQPAFALVKAYDGGCLEQNLQNLLSQKLSAYRGVGLFRRHV